LDMYYIGKETEWNTISIGSNNECLTDASRHYISATDLATPVITQSVGGTISIPPILLKGQTAYAVGIPAVPWTRLVSLVVDGKIVSGLSFTVPDTATVTVTGVFAPIENYVDGGSCGAGLQWYLTDENSDRTGETLTIYGYGAMKNYSNHALWKGYRANITTVILELGVTTIGDYAFSDCSSLTSITIPSSVKAIGNYAFSDCSSLSSIAIPNGVTTIGDSAFEGCSLTSITIPNSVTTIGNGAFSNCNSLTSAYYTGDLAAWCGISFGSSSANPMRYAKYLYIDGRRLSGVVVIPVGATAIGRYAFYNCSSLTSIDIPRTVTTIGDDAFYGCYNLKSVDIPNSVKTIGSYAFEWCSSLTSIVIPEGITTINYGTFLNCESLKSITIPNGVTTIDDCAFNYCSSLTSITIPSSVKTIGSYAFCACSSLTSITIPNGVAAIVDHTFSGCDSLTSITIPNSVTSIGEWAFSDCSSLTSITIPSSVKTIGSNAFRFCSSLTSIALPTSVTSIGDSCFLACDNLKSITITGSVTSIGEDAFSHCSSLTRVYYTGNLAAWCGISFGDSLANPIWYANELYIDGALLSGAVVIPEGITFIGAYAFYNYSKLTSITIPESVTTIGDYAFEECNNLTDVYYLGTEVQWGSISIGSGNWSLNDANIKYLPEGVQAEPSVSGTTLSVTAAQYRESSAVGFLALYSAEGRMLGIVQRELPLGQDATFAVELSTLHEAAASCRMLFTAGGTLAPMSAPLPVTLP